MKKVFKILVVGLFVALGSCSEEVISREEVINKEEIKISSKMFDRKTYNPDNDPPPFLCCLTRKVEGLHTDISVSNSRCSLNGGFCYYYDFNYDGNEDYMGIIEQIDNGKILAQFSLLDNNTLIMKTIDYGGEELLEAMNVNTNFIVDVDKPNFIYEQFNITIKEGEYEIMNSLEQEFKHVIKFDIEIN